VPPLAIIQRAQVRGGGLDWQRLAAVSTIVTCALILLAGAVPALGQTPAEGSTRTAPAAPNPPDWFKGAVQGEEPGVTMPVLVKSAKPVYPAKAYIDGITGVVHIEARVEVNGRIRNARVVKSIPPLDANALEAAKKFEFRPAMRDGMAVPAIVHLELSFNISTKR
jgi:protein TonB